MNTLGTTIEYGLPVTNRNIRGHLGIEHSVINDKHSGVGISNVGYEFYLEENRNDLREKVIKMAQWENLESNIITAASPQDAGTQDHLANEVFDLSHLSSTLLASSKLSNATPQVQTINSHLSPRRSVGSHPMKDSSRDSEVGFLGEQYVSDTGDLNTLHFVLYRMINVCLISVARL
jgi:hypothetical protein